jgi:hypothetical protein
MLRGLASLVTLAALTACTGEPGRKIASETSGVASTGASSTSTASPTWPATTTTTRPTRALQSNESVIVALQDVLGWWDGDEWVPGTSTPLPLTGGELYSVVGIDAPVTRGRGSEPEMGCELNDEPGVKVAGLAWGDGEEYAPAYPIAVAGIRDVQPRAVTVLAVTPEYVDAARKVLFDLGVRDPEPRVEQVVRADLDGDRTDEVIVTADHGSAGWSGGALGDASAVFLRRVVNGELQTMVVAHGVVSDPEFPYQSRTVYRVGAVADLNGDGAMELAVSSRYYEGSGTLLFDLSGGGAARRVLEVWCGA